MISDGTPTVAFAELRGRGFTRIVVGRLRRNARRGRHVEETSLPGIVGEAFPPWPEQQPFERQILFLQTRVRALQLLGRGAGLVQLTFEVVKEALQMTESLERSAEP